MVGSITLYGHGKLTVSLEVVGRCRSLVLLEGYLHIVTDSISGWHQSPDFQVKAWLL